MMLTSHRRTDAPGAFSGLLRRAPREVPFACRRRTSHSPSPLALACLCLAAVVSVRAEATTNCAAIPAVPGLVSSTVTYGTGGSSQTPLIGALATKLQAATNPITVVYASPAACTGVTTLLGSGSAGVITSTANYWDANGTEYTCTPPAGIGVPADFAVSGVFATSCSGVTELPASFRDFGGPVLAWDFIVPATGSDQFSISAQAAYFVFGDGASGSVVPWANGSNAGVFIRTSTSAAQIAIGQAISVPASGFKGTSESSNTNMITAVYGYATPENSLGFVSSDVADASASKVRVLAYQHFDQSCGYLPDSTSSIKDKANVRDGQYYLWSGTHFISFVDQNGNPLGNSLNNDNAATAALINSISFASGAPLSPEAVLTAEISTGNIPECAMTVGRSSDIGPQFSYEPTAPCVGFYEFTATGSTTSTPCTSTCPGTQVCRYGYCEVQ